MRGVAFTSVVRDIFCPFEGREDNNE